MSLQIDPADLSVTMRRVADHQWVVRITHRPTDFQAESEPIGSATRAREQAIERLLEAIRSEIEQSLYGVCGEEDLVAERLGLSLEDVEQAMEGMGYERCPDCCRWVETWELVDDDLESVPCLDCREA